MVSRRGFMKKGSLVLLTAGASLGAVDRVFGHALQPATDPPQISLTKATFTPYINTDFRIYFSSTRVVTAKLESIADIGPVPDRPVPGRESFVLRFDGPEILAKQNTYRIEHASLGSFDLFLVPGDRDKNKKGYYYLATINRLNA